MRHRIAILAGALFFLVSPAIARSLNPCADDVERFCEELGNARECLESLVRQFSEVALGTAVSTSSYALSSDYFVKLTSQNFTILVGKGCGGGEGVLLFFLCSLLCFLNSARNRFWQWTAFIPIGLLSILLLNVVRLTVLFVSGILLRRYQLLSLETYQLLIHSNLGWLMYGTAMYPLFRMFSLFQDFANRAVLPIPTLRRQGGFG